MIVTATQLSRAQFTVARTWVVRASASFLATVDRLSDRELGHETDLRGWTRRHLVAHVAADVTAVGLLVSWATGGTESPICASSAERGEQIERRARLSTAELRARVSRTVDELELAFATAAPVPALSTQAATTERKPVMACELPWLRSREIAVHCVDLHAGVGFDDLPVRSRTALVTDVDARRSSRIDGPALRLTATDNPSASWLVRGPGPTLVVSSPTAQLAAWLTGRAGPEDLPTLPPGCRRPARTKKFGGEAAANTRALI